MRAWTRVCLTWSLSLVSPSACRLAVGDSAIASLFSALLSKTRVALVRNESATDTLSQTGILSQHSKERTFQKQPKSDPGSNATPHHHAASAHTILRDEKLQGTMHCGRANRVLKTDRALLAGNVTVSRRLPQRTRPCHPGRGPHGPPFPPTRSFPPCPVAATAAAHA